MDAVDSFFRKQMLAFPLVLPTRTAVLEQIFCVIGNGYEWSEDGTIVSTDANEYPAWDKDIRLADIETTLNDYPEAVREFVRGGLVECYKDELAVVENIDELLHTRPAIKDIYPQSEYALLMNIPANAQPEWKAAADEARSLAVEAGWVF